MLYAKGMRDSVLESTPDASRQASVQASSSTNHDAIESIEDPPPDYESEEDEIIYRRPRRSLNPKVTFKSGLARLHVLATECVVQYMVDHMERCVEGTAQAAQLVMILPVPGCEDDRTQEKELHCPTLDAKYAIEFLPQRARTLDYWERDGVVQNLHLEFRKATLSEKGWFHEHELPAESVALHLEEELWLRRENLFGLFETVQRQAIIMTVDLETLRIELDA